MKRHSFQIILGVVLLAGFLLSVTKEAVADTPTRPVIPMLSLTKTGEEGGYDEDWYPDGRVRLPISMSGNSPREFLLPVFIDNRWFHYTSDDFAAEHYIPDPIKSFQFKLLFDSVAIMPIGIETAHPYPDTNDVRTHKDDDEWYAPLAKDFEITWHDYQDSSYFMRFYPNSVAPPSIRGRGRALKISGTSTKPLPNTNIEDADFRVLLYVRFRIMIDDLSVSDLFASGQSAIHFATDTIMYNDLNIRKDAPFKELRKYYPNVETNYPDPNDKTGLGGMDNHIIDQLWNTYPILPGTIYLVLTRELPRFDYRIASYRLFPPIYSSENPQDHPDMDVPDGLWILRDPIVVDSAGNTDGHQVGKYRIQLWNAVPQTRLVDIEVDSDEPWLRFQINSDDRNKFPRHNNPVTKLQYINYIDNQILGSVDDENNQTDSDDDVFLDIVCDPEQIANSPMGEAGGEKCGVYTGYLTLKSTVAQISPVRIRVTFINFRNPAEPNIEDYVADHTGIRLKVRNSRGDEGDATTIAFGTGHRATDKVDMLFGEYAYRTKLPHVATEMHARFYHTNWDTAVAYDETNGFGCMAPNTLLEYGDDEYIESLDVRNINDTTQSFTYLCRFDAGGKENYPVVIQWNIDDFPEDAELWLTDTLDGALFPSVNMRESTQHGQGPVRSYTIIDNDVSSFMIEYTIPRTVEFLDLEGNPKIKRGWNLVSMPLRAKNTAWENIYKNALYSPFQFTKEGWDDADELMPGKGYFVKYDQIIDTKFRGTKIERITKDYFDQGMGDPNEDSYQDLIKINRGWNVIGTLTDKFPIENIAFDPFDGQDPITRPTLDFVLKHGVWAYNPSKGYYSVTNMERGHGYWIKADTLENKVGGYLKLINHPLLKETNSSDYGKQNVLASSDVIKIRDNGQRERDLYLTNADVDFNMFEMPPLPPVEEIFDARFKTNNFVAENENSTIVMQGIEYPMSLTLANTNNTYIVKDALTKEVLGTLNGGSSLVINKLANNAITIEESAAEAALICLPNPVKTTATLKFNVNGTEDVNISLFDMFGSKVMTIVDGQVKSGSVTIDANGLASGSYICKMTSGSDVQIITVKVVK